MDIVENDGNGDCMWCSPENSGQALNRALFVANLDFEHRLSAAHRGALPEPVRRANEELAVVWVAVARDGDLLWTPAAVEEEFFAELGTRGLPRVRPVTEESPVAGPVRLCPWGWTEALRGWGQRHGWQVSAPEQAAVRRLNARSFSFGLEREWGLAPPGAAEIRSLDELVASVRHLAADEGRWILKAEFGMSAREQFRGRGRHPTEPALNWTGRRLQSDGRVFLEPWLECIEEAGLQFTISESGPPQLEGITPLLTGPGGAYRGSRFLAGPEVAQRWQPAVEVGLRAAGRARQLGYFGPLGIDAMRYRAADGSVQLRPLQDINARWTMGRLSLGFRKLLRPGESGTWLHLPWPGDSAESNRRFVEDLVGRLPPGIRAVRTSPYHVGGRPTHHGTLLLLGKRGPVLDQSTALVTSLHRPSAL